MRCYVGVVADAHDPFPACDVCGRTILKGETIHEYLTDSRERIGVCVLCRSRAESSGWIPVSMAHTIAEEEPRRSRGHALKQRLKGAAARARASRGRRGDASRSDEGAAPEPPWEDLDSAMGHPNEGAWPPPADEAAQPEVAAGADEAPAQAQAPADSPSEPAQAEEERAEQPAKPTRARKQAKPRAKRQPRQRAAKREATPQAERPKPARKAKRGPEALMRRAVERFNSSEERRKVAGLIRSLGEPNAGVRPDQRRQLALVTVAWELSWYQWEVGADGDGDDGEPVREVAKGAEVSELDDEARAWNAAVDEDGTLRLRSSTGQRKQAAQEA
jgi:hypothetical protein